MIDKNGSVGSGVVASRAARNEPKLGIEREDMKREDDDAEHAYGSSAL